MKNPIVMTPGVCGGKPRFEGTRVCVSQVAWCLANGVGEEGLLRDYKSLNKGHLRAARKVADAAMENLRRPWVYIASPYSKGNTARNVRSQMDTFDILLPMGVVPIAPLWSHFQDIVNPLRYSEWLKYDLEIVKRCDAVLRQGGDSRGADREVRAFRKAGKPVFRNFDEVEDWVKNGAYPEDYDRYAEAFAAMHGVV